MINLDSTGDATARSVADIFSRHLEKTRLRQEWIGHIRGKLDVKRSFGAVSEQELTDILSGVYDDITLGNAGGNRRFTRCGTLT
jgi:hypothetical protein